MIRTAKLIGSCAVAGILLYFWLGSNPSRFTNSLSTSQTVSAQAAEASWANHASLPDHFARHGADFGARNADEYALLAMQFLQRARSEGLPAKADDRGVLRVFDPRSGTFGAYNRDGTTKTFFKPGSTEYFERQPGRMVDLRTWR